MLVSLMVIGSNVITTYGSQNNVLITQVVVKKSKYFTVWLTFVVFSVFVWCFRIIFYFHYTASRLSSWVFEGIQSECRI